ncbi:uncharacterized protein LOC116851192 [Odontomachus brunneus]|uniref:uncharacterized protein LOC116851192 n=1 Tax=Odontomachus brunneus TaxID=486640 RepID=UPI0013F19FEE|nr:uncharacterized protein LOC116851192 [Odontomachus brunneus]
MAISASFHRNVFLLNQLVPPSDSFKKHFREGMFDKPNTAGFIQVTYYLLTICDVERFRKLVEWPIVCKKTEAKYRNDVKDYLNTISLENPDIGFPPVLSTYLHHASGTKFMIVMWKLSQLTIRRYIMHNGGNGEVLFAPKPGSIDELNKTYLQQSKANINRNIASHHRSCLQMEKAANSALAEEKEELAKIKAELFDKKQSMVKYIAEAPVDASIKQRLADVEDSEVIQMWKSSLKESVRYIRKRVGNLKDLEKICENINGIISNLLNNSKALDGKQLKEINCSVISELPFPPIVQCCLYKLYNDNKLIYNNFISLFTLILCQVYQSLRKNYLVDLSQCLLQVQASQEDMKSMYNVFKTLLTSIINYTEETENIVCKRNTTHITEQIALPLMKSVLLMPSPLIKINTNCADEKNDLHKLLQFTPGEIPHKSLFSRYTRRKQNHTPDLRTNLLVSRIDINDMILSNNENQSLNMRFMTPHVNRLHKKTIKKYTRLFSAGINGNVKANNSMISLSSNTQANSSIIENTIGKEFNSWGSNLDENITRSLFNLSEEPVMTAQYTPTNISQDTIEETADVLNHEFKIAKPELDELTEIEFVNDDNKGIVLKQDNTSRRRSISDLVERYKKVLETSNCATVKFQKECTEYEME